MDLSRHHRLDRHQADELLAAPAARYAVARPPATPPDALALAWEYRQYNDGEFDYYRADTLTELAAGCNRLVGTAESAAAITVAARTADRMAFGVAEELRDLGLSVLQHCGGGSFKAQMKKADASGAVLAVILGEDEAASGAASVKHLRQEREQMRVARAELPDTVSSLLFLEEDQERA